MGVPSTQYTAAFMVTRTDRNKSILGSGESKRTTVLDAGGLNGEDPVEVLLSLKNQVDLALTREMGLKEEREEQAREAEERRRVEELERKVEAVKAERAAREATETPEQPVMQAEQLAAHEEVHGPSEEVKP